MPISGLGCVANAVGLSYASICAARPWVRMPYAAGASETALPSCGRLDVVAKRCCLCLRQSRCRSQGCHHLTGLRRETWTVPQGTFLVALCRHKCSAIADSTWGISTYPLASPALRVARASSCTSRKKGTGAKHGCELCATPRNQSSNRERSGQGEKFYLSPVLVLSRASMVINSESNSASPSSPEDNSPLSDTAINI